jgi:hypothetical protein
MGTKKDLPPPPIYAMRSTFSQSREPAGLAAAPLNPNSGMQWCYSLFSSTEEAMPVFLPL